MISLLINSKFSLGNLNENVNIFKSIYGNDDLYVYYKLAQIIYFNKKLFDFDNKHNIQYKFETENDYKQILNHLAKQMFESE